MKFIFILLFCISIFLPEFGFAEYPFHVIGLNHNNPDRLKGSNVRIALIEGTLFGRDFKPIPENLSLRLDNIHYGGSILKGISDHALTVSSILADTRTGIAPEAEMDLYYTDLTQSSLLDMFSKIDSKKYDIISCSMKINEDFCTLIGFYLQVHDCLFVVSAGNVHKAKTQKDIDIFKKMGVDHKIIFAASLDNEYKKSDFSTYPSRSTKKMFLYAPGEIILPRFKKNGQIDYQLTRGTSISAPMIAGVAALVKDYLPDISASELKQILFDAAFLPDTNPEWGWNGIVRLPHFLPDHTSLTSVSEMDNDGSLYGAPRIHSFDPNSTTLLEMRLPQKFEIYFPNSVRRYKDLLSSADIFVRLETRDVNDLLLRPHPYVFGSGSHGSLFCRKSEEIRAVLFDERGRRLQFMDDQGHSKYMKDEISLMRNPKSKKLNFMPRNFVLPKRYQNKIQKTESFYSYIQKKHDNDSSSKSSFTFHWVMNKNDASLSMNLLQQYPRMDHFIRALGRTHMKKTFGFLSFARLTSSMGGFRLFPFFKK